jgi:hypothetical protein
MRRVLAALAAAAAVLALLTGFAPAAGAHTPYCGITWGSLPKAGGQQATWAGTVEGMRTGRHRCFDRLVVDVAGPVASYDVRYVDGVRSQGSGFPVALRGDAYLQIYTVPNYDDDYRPTWTPADRDEAVDVSGHRTFEQVAFDGSYEGRSLTGLGVRARLPFRAFALSGPGGGNRLVIDVAHRW